MEDITTVKNEIIEGVGNTVTKRLTDEFKDKYMSKEEANGIKDEVKELRENMEKRLNGGFGRIDKKDREEMKPFINHFFLKNILKLDDVPNTKAIAPTSGTLLDLIPTEISAILIEKLNTYSLLRQNCTIYPGEKGIVYAEATAATAARMTTRGTAVSEGTPTYTPVSYSTVGMQSWVPIDNKVVRESPARIFEWGTTILVKSFAALEYTEFITGSGTNCFEGLNSNDSISTSTPAAHTTIATLDATDTEAWFRSLPAAYRMAGISATWAIGGTTLATQLASLNAATKEYWNANVSPETWHGRRYWEHSSVTTSGTDHPVGYFGDLSYFYLFDKLGQMLRRTDVGYTLTLADSTLLALYGETDGKVVLPEAFYSLTLHG